MDADLSKTIDNLNSISYQSFRPTGTGGAWLPALAMRSTADDTKTNDGSGQGKPDAPRRCDGCRIEAVTKRVWGLSLCAACAPRANWRADRFGLSVRVVVGEEWKSYLAGLRTWLKRQSEVKR